MRDTRTMLAAAGLAVCLLALPAFSGQDARNVRPVKDDVGFCWNPASMKVLIDYLDSKETVKPPAGGLVAAISPHDDYLYAGRVYYPLFRALRTREVVVFGVTHGTVRKEIGDPHNILILDSYPLWPGLGKPIGVSPLREEIKKALDPSYFVVNDKAHALEHSIEAELPFLQYFNPDVTITPIMVTGMPFEKMEELSEKLAGIIAGYMKTRGLKAGRDIFFLISADGNHYGQDFNNSPYGEGQKAWETARADDSRLIEAWLTGPMDVRKIRGVTTEFWGKTFADYGHSYWCGKYSIPFGLLTASKVIELTEGRKLAGRLFRCSDTYSEGALPLVKTGMGTTAPFSLRHWVSFCSIGYYLQ